MCELCVCSAKPCKHQKSRGPMMTAPWPVLASAVMPPPTHTHTVQCTACALNLPLSSYPSDRTPGGTTPLSKSILFTSPSHCIPLFPSLPTPSQHSHRHAHTISFPSSSSPPFLSPQPLSVRAERFHLAPYMTSDFHSTQIWHWDTYSVCMCSMCMCMFYFSY